MKKENAYYIGQVVKTHGLKGELGMVFDMDNPEDYLQSDTLFVEEKGGLVPYFMEEFRFNANKAVVKLEEVDTLEAAQALCGCGLYIPLGDVPQSGEGEIFNHELIGFRVESPEHGHLGEVMDVYDLKSHTLLAVMHKGKEVLIPLHEDIVQDIDKEGQSLTVALPDGLLDIYL